MGFEKPKKSSTIESTISEIKEAEEEKEVEGAVEEFEIEAIAENITDEMPVLKNEDKEKKTERTKSIIEKLEINPDTQERKEAKKRLIEYSKEIYKTGNKYEMVYSYFEPSGKIDEETGERRTYIQEIDFYLEQREGEYKEEHKDVPNARDLQEKYKKVYGEYNLTITYPELDKIKQKNLVDDREELEKIEEEIKKEKNDSLKNILFETISKYKANINILIEIKKGNKINAFENGLIAYGDIDNELCEKVEDLHKKRIEFLREKKEEGSEKSNLRKLLEERELNAEEIKWYFEKYFEEAGLKDDEFPIKAIIDEKIKAIDVRFNDPRYDYPVMLIPIDKKANGIEVLNLLAHEGRHIIANRFGAQLGLEGLSFGKDWEVVHEGNAKLEEVEIKKEILGNEYSELEERFSEEYILAMKKIKELIFKEIEKIIEPEINELTDELIKKGKDETEVRKEIGELVEKRSKEIPIENINIGELYDYLFELKKEEFLVKGKNEKISEEKAAKFSKEIIRRVVRGMYPYYFSKDKAYFEGRIIAKEMKEAGVSGYTVQSKIDPKLAKDFIELGIDIDIEDKKYLEEAKEAVERMWDKNGWAIEHFKYGGVWKDGFESLDKNLQ